MSNIIKLLDRVQPVISFEVYLEPNSDKTTILNVYKAEDLSEREYLQWIEARASLLEINQEHKKIKEKYIPDFPDIPESLTDEEKIDWLNVEFENTLSKMESPPEIPNHLFSPVQKYRYLIQWVDDNTPKEIVDRIVKFEQESITAARRWVEILCKLNPDALINLPNKTLMQVYKNVQENIQQQMRTEMQDNLEQMASNDPKQ